MTQTDESDVEWISVAQAATEIGKRVQQINAWAVAGKINFKGKPRMIDRGSLQRYLATPRKRGRKKVVESPTLVIEQPKVEAERPVDLPPPRRKKKPVRNKVVEQLPSPRRKQVAKRKPVVEEVNDNVVDINDAPAKRRKANDGSNRKAHISDVRDRIKRNDYSNMPAGRLVALYWICHETVYGVFPIEIDKPNVWRGAMSAATRMVKTHFDGDMERAIIFMRWVWDDERRKETWLRNNKKQGRRISWQNQFMHDYLVTNWRAAAARAKGFR